MNQDTRGISDGKLDILQRRQQLATKLASKTGSELYDDMQKRASEKVNKCLLQNNHFHG